MRLIQNKLSTPTSSMENLNQYNKYKNSSYKKLEPKTDAISSNKTDAKNNTNAPSTINSMELVSTPETTSSRTTATTEKTVYEESVPTKPPSNTTKFADSLSIREEVPKPASEKVYKYRGPPSISVSTWSERPKVPVNIKEDSDYKLSNHNVNSKLIVNTTNNDVISNNSVEVRNKVNNTQGKDSGGVSVKVNVNESVNDNQYQSGSNVVIKIGSMNGNNRPKTIDNQRFISHTTAVGYRKPFSTISNKQKTQRPHSIAFDSDFDISRVPVVRSFELKKPYKDMSNTSVIQIYHDEDKIKSSTLGRTESTSELSSRFASMQNRHREPEEASELAKKFATMSNRHSYASSNGTDVKEPKPVFRVGSFKPLGAAPVVRGFKQTNETSNNKMTWNGSGTYNTLPVKSKELDASQNNNNKIPFSQPLRRTESSKIADKNSINQDDSSNVSNSFTSLQTVPKPEVKAPPPPMMPKNTVARKPIEPVVDQRDQLLSAIRNFGGKKGLKAVKV